jgi:uncharacterized protein involved in tolerance to divalent cations
MEDSIYQIIIKCDDDITLIIFTEAPENSEAAILEKIYDKHYDQQPDISKYKITNLTKDYSKSIGHFNPTLITLAFRAMSYSEEFN